VENLLIIFFIDTQRRKVIFAASTYF